ncbi:hypothetical protein [Ralstonia solanacearum]|uniref:hypothetical protein n=1 Tax=Ralstonia solanacearum TaxID=305 RepID=UPI0019694A61|nr:hypothetical protein [Ralstonia solanacearum]
MVKKIENVLELWDNGFTSSAEERDAAVDRMKWWDDFYEISGARKQIATRWTYQGNTYEDSNCPRPIPDMSGLVYATSGWKTWIVLNPDGTQRVVIHVPRISEKSIPENGDLGEPHHMKGDALHVMYGEGGDGDRDDCRFHFDMHTGELLQVDLVGRHW